tara:strand:+ start:769 stop:1224 length:456 start_codon:yes stop_codon:yes gene_type:complete
MLSEKKGHEPCQNPNILSSHSWNKEILAGEHDMRLNNSTQILGTETHQHTQLDGHPVVSRAREAYRNDQIGVSPSMGDQATSCRGRITYSTGLIGDARAQGVSEADVLAVLGSGRRERRWDGCLIVRDWFLGLEVQLDPSGQHGMRLRRVG